jgi:hypothetical protein
MRETPRPWRSHRCAEPAERNTDVHEFEFGVGARFRDLVYPFRHGLTISTRARASDNDRDIDHVINRDRLIQDVHPGGAQAASDIFSPTP